MFIAGVCMTCQSVKTTSFPGSLILPPLGKMRDRGSEVDVKTVQHLEKGVMSVTSRN